MEQKFVSPQRTAQIRFERLPFRKPRVHFAAEELIVIPAVLLGFVHGVVRSIYQAFRILPVAGVGTDPDTHVDIKIFIIDTMRRRQRPEDFSRAEGRVFRMLDLGEEYHEFVPA